MEKQYMTHEEVLSLIKEGYDIKGFLSKDKPSWHRKVYDMWKGMWKRCYDPSNGNYSRYYLSIIYDDFRIFSNYYNWIKSQPRFEEFCSTCDDIMWSVDKDIKVKDNIHYFPEFMTLCPHKENARAAHSRYPIIGINITDNTILLYKSANDAQRLTANDMKFSKGAISDCCKGARDHKHKGYRWYYL